MVKPVEITNSSHALILTIFPGAKSRRNHFEEVLAMQFNGTENDKAQAIFVADQLTLEHSDASTTDITFYISCSSSYRL